MSTAHGFIGGASFVLFITFLTYGNWNTLASSIMLGLLFLFTYSYDNKKEKDGRTK